MIINEDIRARELRVIGDNGEQIVESNLLLMRHYCRIFGLDLVLLSHHQATCCSDMDL